ncbi:efflux RND transporter permease subunit [Halomarina oriensis]|uniref:MMPL family transporter n=1 Tax=Halomarina oriensis TaxID=671145 RepID=A0A6B0GPV1_9EURY|nr:MMPL family transporter [Halomarina oriensis]MWG36814.1 MMPL family transporter [Halomarina oriensis]
MGLVERYAVVLTRYSRVFAVAMLVATVVVGAGAPGIEGGLTIASFESDSVEAQKLDAVESNFSVEGENTTAVQIVVTGENVLTRASLVETLELQQRLRANESINATLAEDQPTVGLSNVVAIAAIRAEAARAGGGAGGPPPGGDGTVNGTSGANASGGPPSEAGSATNVSSNTTTTGTATSAGGPPVVPSLDAQRDQLESMSDGEVAEVVERVLSPDSERPGGVDPFTLVSTEYEPGTATADARILFAFQQTDPESDALSEGTVTAQLAIQEEVESTFGERGFVFGQGIVDEESGQATGESFAIISPIALAFVLLVLVIAYRDPLDVLLALLGVVLVLVWMGGFMGWAGIGVTQILIAVPFLLIGLSIDYALHVVMRYREARPDADSPRAAMGVGLAGVTAALAATTFTTSIGFFSNLASDIGSIREFGLVAGVGIVATFLVFVVLLPAVKLELEGLLERVGRPREKSAFGTGGLTYRLLSVGTGAARRIPLVVVVVALVVSAGGGYAATDIDTSLDRVEFLPRDAPEWMNSLPGPFQPSDYDLRENALFLNDNFVQSNAGSRVEILLEGPVTDDDTLERVAEGEAALADTETAIELANGEPSVDDPLSVMRDVAATNETFDATFTAADTDGNAIPDRNLDAVYEGLFAAAPDRAASVVARSGSGEAASYTALRMSVTTVGGADTGEVTEEMRGVATTVEEGSALTVTATGSPVVTELVQQSLLRTLVETFLITLGIILAFLTAIFYRRYGTLTLGAVTMVPVVFALSWILGTMYLVGIPFNTETVIIASVAIGIGVDYAIHISERFVEERAKAGSAFDALDRTVSGTGGAVLASAVTTAGGFGVLTFALVPSLRRFGLVTGSAIVYAFVASVVVLPSLLVLWDRSGSRGSDESPESTGTEQVPTDD